jgi:hypothetical protein
VKVEKGDMENAVERVAGEPNPERRGRRLLEGGQEHHHGHHQEGQVQHHNRLPVVVVVVIIIIAAICFSADVAVIVVVVVAVVVTGGRNQTGERESGGVPPEHRIVSPVALDAYRLLRFLHFGRSGAEEESVVRVEVRTTKKRKRKGEKEGNDVTSWRRGPFLSYSLNGVWFRR